MVGKNLEKKMQKQMLRDMQDIQLVRNYCSTNIFSYPNDHNLNQLQALNRNSRNRFHQNDHIFIYNCIFSFCLYFSNSLFNYRLLYSFITFFILMLNNLIKQKRKIKIVATSDTHGNNQQMLKLIDNKQTGDIFIHAGDFTRYGRDYHFQNFISIIKKLNFKHKIVISGNHQIILDDNINPAHKQLKMNQHPCKYSKPQILQMFKQHCIYLEHQQIQIQGIKIFGSPYVKKYGRSAFQYDHSLDKMLWSQVPKVDIMLTHSPPYGILDKSDGGHHAGSQALKQRIFEIKPKLHLFGHIHEARGQQKQQGIHFVNLAKRIVKFELQI